MPDTPTEAGVIHDIGYQRYTGPRLARGYVLTSLYLHGLRTAFGLGRSAKAKIFPWFTVGIVGLTATVLAVVRSRFGEEVDDVTGAYLGFADTMSWLVIFFVAIVGPELVSRDLRSGVLALYFTRPLSSSDYALARLAALASAIWLLLGAPQLLMFAIAAFSADGPAAVWTELGDVVAGLLYAGVWAAVFAAIGLLVASLTGRRAFGAGGIVAVFLVSSPVVAVLAAVPSTTMNDLAGLFAPSSLVQGIRMWLFDPAGTADGGLGIGAFGPLYAATAAALVAGCVVLLLARYRRVAKR